MFFGGLNIGASNQLSESLQVTDVVNKLGTEMNVTSRNENTIIAELTVNIIISAGRDIIGLDVSTQQKITGNFANRNEVITLEQNELFNNLKQGLQDEIAAFSEQENDGFSFGQTNASFQRQHTISKQTQKIGNIINSLYNYNYCNSNELKAIQEITLNLSAGRDVKNVQVEAKQEAILEIFNLNYTSLMKTTTVDNEVLQDIQKAMLASISQSNKGLKLPDLMLLIIVIVLAVVASIFFRFRRKQNSPQTSRAIANTLVCTNTTSQGENENIHKTWENNAFYVLYRDHFLKIYFVIAPIAVIILCLNEIESERKREDKLEYYKKNSDDNPLERLHSPELKAAFSVSVILIVTQLIAFIFCFYHIIRIIKKYYTNYKKRSIIGIAVLLIALLFVIVFVLV